MERFISGTRSLCPECLEIINARVVEEKGKLYIDKTCKRHGYFKARHPLGDLSQYSSTEKLFKDNNRPKMHPEGLVINLNSRCNMNCPFCFAMANEIEMKEPSIKEIKNRISGFTGSTIYLSGGEPTLREDLFDIIREIKESGYRVFLFTNGKRLADIGFVRRLKKTGVDLVILQFDTFDERQCEILRGERLAAVKSIAVENLKQVEIPIYLFIMLVKDLNIDQIGNIIKFASENSRSIKIINFNPVWEMGRVGEHEPMNMSDIFGEIKAQSGLSTGDFIDSTAFSYYAFEILRKVTGRKENKQPWCEMRAYVASDNGGLVTMGQLIDLRRLNMYLKDINDRLDGKNNFKKTRLFLHFPYHFFIKEFLTRRKLRSFMLRSAKSILKQLCKKKFPDLIRFDVFSIIVGTFHTALNIDLELVDTCNLYSDFPDGEIRRSSCLRQISVTSKEKV